MSPAPAACHSATKYCESAAPRLYAGIRHKTATSLAAVLLDHPLPCAGLRLQLAASLAAALLDYPARARRLKMVLYLLMLISELALGLIGQLTAPRSRRWDS